MKENVMKNFKKMFGGVVIASVLVALPASFAFAASGTGTATDPFIDSGYKVWSTQNNVSANTITVQGLSKSDKVFIYKATQGKTTVAPVAVTPKVKAAGSSEYIATAPFAYIKDTATKKVILPQGDQGKIQVLIFPGEVGIASATVAPVVLSYNVPMPVTSSDVATGIATMTVQRTMDGNITVTIPKDSYKDGDVFTIHESAVATSDALVTVTAKKPATNPPAQTIVTIPATKVKAAMVNSDGSAKLAGIFLARTSKDQVRATPVVLTGATSVYLTDKTSAVVSGYQASDNVIVNKPTPITGQDSITIPAAKLASPSIGMKAYLLKDPAVASEYVAATSTTALNAIIAAKKPLKVLTVTGTGGTPKDLAFTGLTLTTESYTIVLQKTNLKPAALITAALSAEADSSDLVSTVAAVKSYGVASDKYAIVFKPASGTFAKNTTFTLYNGETKGASVKVGANAVTLADGFIADTVAKSGPNIVQMIVPSASTASGIVSWTVTKFNDAGVQIGTESAKTAIVGGNVVAYTVPIAAVTVTVPDIKIGDSFPTVAVTAPAADLASSTVTIKKGTDVVTSGTIATATYNIEIVLAANKTAISQFGTVAFTAPTGWTKDGNPVLSTDKRTYTIKLKKTLQ